MIERPMHEVSIAACVIVGAGVILAVYGVWAAIEKKRLQNLTPRERWAMWAEERRRRAQPVVDDGWGLIQMLIILRLLF
ncbi:hypothetical protein GIR35_12310 [Enterococcus faecalis]|nr:hypothetical protein GIR35_12310 [Enterococcus faecalis]